MKKYLILLFLCGTTLLANCQTSISGGYVSGTWTVSGSPYLVQGSIMIGNDSLLTIQPGVEVNFQGHYKLLVSGRLLAIGTITDSIYFTAADTSLGWYGIRFDNTPSTNDTSKIFYCSINWGKATGTVLDSYGGAFMFNNFSKAIISNCLMQNNSATANNFLRGGAIYCTNSSPSFLFNEISYCSGGCAYLTNYSNPYIAHNKISNNNGIGIYLEGGNINLYIYDNIISYNSKWGIFCTASSVKILNNTITYNNTANNPQPGGIWTDLSSTLISKNIISYNLCSSNGYGGGIFTYNSTDTITDNFVSNNTAVSGGGINIYVPIPSTANSIISNNVISNNTANGSAGIGGGIICNGSNPTLSNNTIVNNSANKGGGLYCNAANPSLSNCILYGNTATIDGDQVFLFDEPSDPNFYYCNLQGGSAAFGMNGNFYTGTYINNINSIPLFIAPSGGSGTSYNGITADWSLQPLSPCINTGDPNGSYPPNDIAGNPRVVNGIIDMGAYEYQGNVGIADYDLQNQIIIYPNLVTDKLNIKASNEEPLEITFYDIASRKILQQKFTNYVSLNTEQLAKGLYLYEVRDKNGLCKKGKVVKD